MVPRSCQAEAVETEARERSYDRCQVEVSQPAAQASICPALRYRPKLVNKAGAMKPNKKVTIIGDTGAGRMSADIAHLVKQGIPRSIIDKCTGKASTTMVMETANGTITVDKSFGFTSSVFGTHEYYIINNCEMFLGSIGLTVEKEKRPFLWLPGNSSMITSKRGRVNYHYGMSDRFLRRRLYFRPW